MALGVQGVRRWEGGSAGAPKRGPQHFLVNDQLRYVHEVTRSFRAAELTVVPRRTRTYNLRWTPKTAVRLETGIREQPGAPPWGTSEQTSGYNLRRVRETLVARSRLIRTVERAPGSA